MFIFKGEQNSRIATKEFQTFPIGYEYFYQKIAWMYKGEMLDLVEKNLKPFISITPGNAILLLMLDSHDAT